MFYEEKQIKKALNCEKCQRKFQIPYVLPCGRIICNRCLLSLDKNTKCNFCSNHHNSSATYPICRPLLDLLTEEPIDVNNTHSSKLLKQNLKAIQSQLNDLNYELNNRQAILQQHFASLRNEIQVSSENLIKNVNLNCDLLLNKIDDTEQHYMKVLQSKSSEFFESFAKDLDEISTFHSKWNDYLEQTAQIDNNLIIQGNSSANYLRKILEKKRGQLNNFIFDNNIIKFKKSNSKINENLIGALKIRKALSLSVDDLNWGTVLFEKTNSSVSSSSS